ncbi:MAG TPA: 4-alpha-glucanotransferase [Phototrophicaceae bacterium]|nr:4-alpha-glucanotransferase [Phototrophicaceae bacterium]
MDLFPRSSGILLHPTSLPGRYGIGDLGEWAYHFVDWLASAKQTIWQVLPLGPTGYGDSPYQTLSAFAGNALLVSLDKLVEEGWLSPEDVADVPSFPAEKVDFGWIIPYHDSLLNLAFKNFEVKATEAQKDELHAWAKDNTHWLDDYALFMALKEEHDGQPWVAWEPEEALREPQAMVNALERHTARIEQYKFRQWLFARQWNAVKQYANSKQIRLIGDVPIFVAHDSADVWANRDLFHLDEAGNPTIVAGVPPDYFSETGQLWGNPHYNWQAMERDGYRWWIQRFKATLDQVDIVRIDHFRGFEAYWSVPGGETTAINGQWIKGPGIAFFNVIKAALGGLPLIAEDLGVITPPVEEMRDTLNLPGMLILQFAWGDLTGEARFLPHNHRRHSVVYTGTHDNNTTNGWWFTDEIDDVIRNHMSRYLDRRIVEPNWELIRLAMMSVATTAVIPLQDVMGLGEEARMNKPSVAAGNWMWRFVPKQLEGPAKGRLEEMTKLYARVPEEHGKPRPV